MGPHSPWKYMELPLGAVSCGAAGSLFCCVGSGLHRGQGYGADSLFLVQTARCPSVGRLYDLGKRREKHHQG